MNNQSLYFNGEEKTWRASFMLAMKDIKQGVFISLPIWNMLAWQDIKQRYRRSVIGPFWLTISTAIMVFSLGFLYSGLFKQPLAEYLPFVGVGLIVWMLFSSIITDSCMVFCEAEAMIKQVRQPFTMYVVRMVWRNLIIFSHNFIIIVVIIALSPDLSFFNLLSVPLALIVFSINGVWLGICLGIICSRFRDILPLIASIVQLTFFLTPIMWKPNVLTERAWIVDFNPAYHFINILRSPVLGQEIPFISWVVVISISFFGLLLALIMLTKYRHRIAYWIG